MQHEPRCPARELGAREPRQGDYDDDEAGVVQVLSHQVLDTRNVVARVESCRRCRRRRAHSEVAHNTWHSEDSNNSSSSSSNSSIRERRHRQVDERHKVQEVQVAWQEEETEAEVVDYYERVALPLLLSPSRELLAGIVVVAATTAAAATVAVAAVSVGRGTHLGDWSGIRTSGADIIEQRGYNPGKWSLADRATKWTTTWIIVARVCLLPRRRSGTCTKKETETKGERRSPVQEGIDVYRCTERESEENLVRRSSARRVSADVPEITVAAAEATSWVASRTAFGEQSHEKSSVGEQSACQEAGLRFGGSDAGPPAAARLRYGSSTPRVHRESSLSSSVDVHDIEEKEAAAAKRSIGSGGGSTSHRTVTNVHVKERRRGGARRRRQDVSVPDYPVAPMLLDPFGLTGPPTSKKWRKEKKRVQKKEKEQKLWLSSSSSLSSTSFVECVRSGYRSYTSSKSFSRSIRDRVVDDVGISTAAQYHHEARHFQTGHGPDEKAGTATAFRISRDSASHGVVRARTCDRHEDHEDDNEGDALRARTRILGADCPSPRRRRAPRTARRRSRRRRGSGAISEEEPDVATSAVSFVDVHAYTAYSDDRDDDDDGENDGDDDDDNEGHCERKRIHSDGSKKAHDEYEEDGSNDSAHVSVSDNPRDEYKHENESREDYIHIEGNTSSGVSKSDQWESQSSSFNWKRDRERVYEREYLTVDEVFDGQGRRKGEWYSERRCSDNTAWFQKPITRRKGRGEGRGREGRGRGDKPHIRRSYYRLLLFVLYLLAWPLLCSSSPLGHLASTFAQNPTLAHTKNPAQRGNTTPPDMLFSSSTVIEHQYKHSQQYVQGSDYNTDSERHRHHQQQQQQQQQQQSDQEKPDEQRHPYNEYTWEVNQMNPWLSACDLAGPAPTDLQGSCGAPPPEVPKYCPKLCKNASEIMKTYNVKINRGVEDGGESGSQHGDKYSTDEKKEEKEQCLLYLEESHKKIICQMKKNNPSDLLLRLRLRHCCEHAVFNALAPGKGGPLEDVLNGGKKCDDALDKLLLVDALAARLHCEFEEVLARYDCAQPYSVIHNCTHCKEAYRKWVCSSLVPYFAHRSPKNVKTLEGSWTGPRLRPCRSFCQTVEQRCPYFLPGDRAPAYPTQYAGEPTFLCRDPNIPETGEQAARALHSISDDECCFHVCSEDTKEGICTKCEEPWKHGKFQDPATAPQCEPPVNLQSGSTDPGSQPGQPETSTDDLDISTTPSSSNTTASSTTVGQKDTAFCGSGRIGSISSASSLGRSNPSIVLQFFWLCSILITLPANALQYNTRVLECPFGFLRLIGSGLLFSGTFVLRRVFNDVRVSFDPRSTGIYRFAAIRCLLFVLGMPGRAVMKCRCRGWWWWRSWRRSSSRHFRWKFLRRFGVASQRSVLRDVSIAILELFLKFAAKCRCRDWWWLWRRWRKYGSTGGQYTKLVPRRKRPVIYRAAHQHRRRRRDLSRVLRIDIASSAKSISRKDPP
ncbi:F155B protein, partial [Acromyrmex charruanus]